MNKSLPLKPVRVLVFSTVSLGMLISPFSTFAYSSGSMPLDLSVQPGLLTLSPSTQASLNSVTPNHRTATITNGTLGTFQVDDSRSTFEGWSVNATFSDLSSYSTFTTQSGTPGPFSVHGAYTGQSSLDLTLMTGDIPGALGTVSYTLYDQLGNKYTPGSAAILNASQAIGTTGLSFDAPQADYAANSTYHLHISIIPASGFDITPDTVDALNGQITGVLSGSEHTLTSSNDPITLATANAGYGDGYYESSAHMSLSVPAGTKTGTYHGTIVETLE